MEPEEERRTIKKILDGSFEDMYREDVEDRADEFEKIKRNFLKENTPVKKRKRGGILSKIGFVAALVCVIFVVSLVMADIPEIKAFRYDAEENFNALFSPGEKQTYTELDQLSEREGIMLPSFTYMPEGFEMGEIGYDKIGGHYNLNFNLSKDSEYISVVIEKYNEDEARSEQIPFHDFERIDMEDKIIALSKSQPYSVVILYQLYDIRLATNVGREEVLKIVEGIQ